MSRFHHLTASGIARFCRILTLSALCGGVAVQVQAQNPREEGQSFVSVFPFAGLSDQWWIAEYDHPWENFVNGWREEGVSQDERGVTLTLGRTPVEKRLTRAEMEANTRELMEEGKTWKTFTSGQIQRTGWYSYGRYEIVMRPAAVHGLISAFYVYTGEHFGDPHEEIDIEFLGRVPDQVFLNRFVDGEPLEGAKNHDLGFDSSDMPRLYAFEWAPDSVKWFANGEQLFEIGVDGGIPTPPAKIYFDIWAGAERDASWSGTAALDAEGEMLVQCVSYTKPGDDTPSCSDLYE